MSTLKELQDLIHEKFGIESATLDPAVSMRDFGIDSLALAEFLFEIEDRMGISMPDAVNDVDTLGGLAEVIDKLRVSQSA